MMYDIPSAGLVSMKIIEVAQTRFEFENRLAAQKQLVSNLSIELYNAKVELKTIKATLRQIK